MKDLTTVKQGKATTVRDRSGKCLTEERQILNRWTEYCSELYNYKAYGDPSVRNCTQTDTEDDHPILGKHRQKKKPWITAEFFFLSMRQKERTEKEKILAWRI